MSGRHWAYVAWEPEGQTYVHTETVEHSHKRCAEKNGGSVEVECDPVGLLGLPDELHHVVSADSRAAVMREARIARDSLTGYGEKSWIVYIGEGVVAR